MAMMLLARSAPTWTAPAPATPVPWLVRPLLAGRTWRVQASAPTTALGAGLWLPTHPIHNAMRRGLLTLTPAHEELVKLRIGGQARLVRVHTGFRVPAAPAPARDASLLKTHLDLVHHVQRQDMAAVGFRGATAPGPLVYDAGEALGRLGHARRSDGGFHPDTLHALAARLSALAAMHVWLDEQAPEAGMPFWTFFTQDAPDAPPRPLAGPIGPDRLRQAGRLLVAPGDWWRSIELARYHFPIDAALLALPMDGKGHQVERLALLLACELAVWERAERRHGARAIARGLGPLLAKARAADKDALLADAARRLNTPKRLRAYLAGEGFADEGALAILRQTAGFQVDIKDEAAFWASGRGWVERFWHARLVLSVREDVRPLASSAPTPGDRPAAHWRV